MQSQNSKHADGSIAQMVAIALPMVVSTACDTVMVFTDRLFLSRLSPELMNASMGGGLTVFMLSSFFCGLIGYVTALVAQYFGARQYRNCALTVAQAAIISLLAYPLILAMRPLAYGLFDLMHVSALQLAPQKAYFDILLFGVIISLMRMSVGGFFSGIGKTAIIMTASVTAMVSNVALNYILIYGKLGCPALGIAGAAYATIAGNVIGLLILVCSYFGKDNAARFAIFSSLRFDGSIIRKLLCFGSPAGMELFSNILAFNIMVLLFHSHSFNTATAATVMFNWDMVSFVPLIGIEIGVTSLVGRFMGAHRPQVAHTATMAGLKMGMSYSAVILMLFVFFPKNLVSVFCPPVGEVGALAIFMLRLAALYVLVQAIWIVFVGALRGAGDTTWAMAISMVLHWLMVAILVFILKVSHGSPRLAWGVLVAVFCAFSIIVWRRYWDGKWKNIQLINDAPAPLVIDDFHEVN